MEPTEEQIKEFWEWCGFRDSNPLVYRNGWLEPDGTFRLNLPPIDLNNLFKWAVPKLKAWTLGNSYPNRKLTLCLVSKDYKGGEAEAETPALALFRAIYKIIKEE